MPEGLTQDEATQVLKQFPHNQNSEVCFFCTHNTCEGYPWPRISMAHLFLPLFLYSAPLHHSLIPFKLSNSVATMSSNIVLPCVSLLIPFCSKVISFKATMSSNASTFHHSPASRASHFSVPASPRPGAGLSPPPTQSRPFLLPSACPFTHCLLGKTSFYMCWAVNAVVAVDVGATMSFSMFGGPARKFLPFFYFVSFF